MFAIFRLLDALANENSLKAERKHLEQTIVELEATNQVKPWSPCHDFKADFPQQMVDMFVVENREYLPTILLFTRILTAFLL